MNIYLPMKNDLLDKGEGTIWTGGGLNLPEIVEFKGTKCAKFDGKSRLKLQDNNLLRPLAVWTMQAWIYPIKIGTDHNGNSHVLSNAIIGVTTYYDIYWRLVTATSSDLCGNTVTVSSSILNAWHHVKITSDGTTIYFYLDGEELKTIPRASLGFNQNGFTVGGENGSATADTNFYGYMTQFKLSDVYNDKDLLRENSKILYINKNNEVWAMV